MSKSRPLMSWKAVEATRKELPIHEVAVPVSISAEMAGIDVATLVVSIKDTNSETESNGMAIMSRLAESVFVWFPME
jgi:hypothetical protein